MTLLDADYYPESLPCDCCIHTAKSHDSLGCTEIDCSCTGFEPAPMDEDDRDKAEARADDEGVR